VEIIAKPALLQEAGVSEPPGLVINGILILQGYVPSLTEMKKIIAAVPKDGG